MVGRLRFGGLKGFGEVLRQGATAPDQPCPSATHSSRCSELHTKRKRLPHLHRSDVSYVRTIRHAAEPSLMPNLFGCESLRDCDRAPRQTRFDELEKYASVAYTSL